MDKVIACILCRVYLGREASRWHSLRVPDLTGFVLPTVFEPTIKSFWHLFLYNPTLVTSGKRVAVGVKFAKLKEHFAVWLISLFLPYSPWHDCSSVVIGYTVIFCNDKLFCFSSRLHPNSCNFLCQLYPWKYTPFRKDFFTDVLLTVVSCQANTWLSAQSGEKKLQSILVTVVFLFIRMQSRDKYFTAFPPI